MKKLFIGVLILSLLFLSACTSYDDFELNFYKTDLLNHITNDLAYEEEIVTGTAEMNDYIEIVSPNKKVYYVYNSNIISVKGHLIKKDSDNEIVFDYLLHQNSFLFNDNKIYVFDSLYVTVLNENLEKLDSFKVDSISNKLQHYGMFVLFDGVYSITAHQFNNNKKISFRFVKVFDLDFNLINSDAKVYEFDVDLESMFHFNSYKIKYSNTSTFNFKDKSYFLLDGILYLYKDGELSVIDKKLINILEIKENGPIKYIKINDDNNLIIKNNISEESVINQIDNNFSYTSFYSDKFGTLIILINEDSHKIYFSERKYYQTYVLFINNQGKSSYVKLNGIKAINANYSNGKLVLSEATYNFLHSREVSTYRKLYFNFSN